MTSAIERAVAAVGPEPYYEHTGITMVSLTTRMAEAWDRLPAGHGFRPEAEAETTKGSKVS